MAQAHTDTMDTRKILQPVALERPARGREMKTQDFAELDSKGGAEERRSLKKNRSEVFHEGYVGGKKYLVPDSNLEAMADMINLKMRRIERNKYVSERDRTMENATDPEKDYLKKKEKMIKKLNTLASDSDVSSEISDEEDDWSDEKGGEEEERENLEELSSSTEGKERDKEEGVEEEESNLKDREGGIEIDERRMEGEQGKDEDQDRESGEEGDAEDNVDLKSLQGAADEEEEGSEEDLQKKRSGADKEIGRDELGNNVEFTKLVDEEDRSRVAGTGPTVTKPGKGTPDMQHASVSSREVRKEKANRDATDMFVPADFSYPNAKRYLISGHFKSNRKPIYIVQEYEGPSIVHNKNPEFFTHRSEQDVDMFICGEFFKESILEEDRYMQPVSLKTSPRRMAVDWRSRVFEEKFSHVFVGSEVDVQLSGSFIEHPQLFTYTPVISIVLRNGSARPGPGPPGGGAAVHVTRPIAENKFAREVAWQTASQKCEEGKKRSVGFEDLGGRERAAFEYPEGSEASGPVAMNVTQPEIQIPLHAQGAREVFGFERASLEYLGTARTQDALREAPLPPETARGRPDGLADPGTTSARRQRPLTAAEPPAEESPAELLEAFVRTEGKKRRERRRKNQTRNTVGSLLGRLFFSK